MGKHFGNLIKLRGVTYYVLSPHELKPFHGMIKPGLANTGRRIVENVPYMFLPLMFGLIITIVSQDLHRRYSKKSFVDYVCEEEEEE